MSLDIPRKRGWKLALGVALAALLTATPFVWAGSVGLRGLPGAGGSVQATGLSWSELWSAVVPNPGALLAGGLLLLPFALSTLRSWRRG